MIWFYSGLGLALFPIAALGILLNSAMHAAGMSSNFSFVSSVFLFGLACYFIGKILNQTDDLYRVEWAERLPRHNSFMFIKLEYWGALAILLSMGLTCLWMVEAMKASTSSTASPKNTTEAATVRPTTAPMSAARDTAQTALVTDTTSTRPSPALPQTAPQSTPNDRPIASQTTDDAIAKFGWRLVSEKDPMTDQTNTKMMAESQGRNGIEFEAEFKNEQDFFIVDIRSFRYGKPLELQRQGEHPYTLTPLRVRGDSAQVFDSFGLAAEYKNAFTVLFYDPVAAQRRLDAPVQKTTPQDTFESVFGNFIGTGVLMQYAKARVAKREALLGLSQLLFDISFGDGSHQVIDLNPAQPLFREIVTNALTPPASKAPPPLRRRRNDDASSKTSGGEPAKR